MLGPPTVILLNHLLSENDIDDELFFILLDILVSLPQLGALLLL